MKKILLLLLLTVCIQTTNGQQTIDVKKHFATVGTSELMMLGTFHFNNPGLDDYKPKHDIDIFSAQKQKELQEILEVIKKFGPTKIAVESRKTNQKRIDSLYQEYLAGRFELRANEIYQIGFRLAKMLGHKKVYAVDAGARGYKSDLSDEDYKKKEQYFAQKAGMQVVKRELLIDKKFNELYEIEDELKTKMSLLDYFLLQNDTELVMASHGHYLIGNFKMGEGNDYFGPDNAIWWYNRNLRIFHNLLNINQPGKDKVFLLIGSGHLPILNFLADASIDFDRKEFKDYVKK
ncbi:DUF5694 domain-containing protein [Aquimarina sp. 2201CG5-10]|uniref:DUF5694 domain-containing protein n=1 Tax=Aquimarina callyspongiae TaxID=3098150 RepID=UPI002AB56691|nr:DUF5694 domain-containing protein [Aquimarina sp. 2201CG5-10]MDY8137200.1 DUF5694 domain-containing protein [Aquimarina sp. 2201CG5-10]